MNNNYIGSRGWLSVILAYLSRFQVGDVKEWFQWFEISTRANGWEVGTKVKKLPTLLEGEALAVWLELTNAQQEDYAESKRAMEKAIMPMNIVSLDDFHRRKL